MAKILFYGLEFFVFWITNGEDTRMFPVCMCVCVCACTITPIVPKQNDPKNMAHNKTQTIFKVFPRSLNLFFGGVWEDDFLLLGKSWFDYLFKSLSCIVQVLCVYVHGGGDNVSPSFCKALNIILSFCNHNCTLDKDLPSLKHFLMQVREHDSFQYCWVGLV